jgi:hypothetical protein
MNQMLALLNFLVLLAIFLLASKANAFTSLSPVARNQVQGNQWFQFVEPMSKLMNEPTREPTIRMDFDAELLNNLSPNQHKSSNVSLLVACAKCLNSNESSCASLLVARAKCLKSHESSCASKVVRAKCLKPNNLSQINNAVLSNHSNQQESLADQPGIDEEIVHPIATTDSSQTTPINIDSSGLHRSTTMTNQHSTAHLPLASPRSFSSARKPISTICSFQYGFSSSMVQSLAVKVQVSSTTKVSCHAFTLLAFEPVTSKTKISSAKTALKATAEMQPSADICQYPGPLVE